MSHTNRFPDLLFRVQRDIGTGHLRMVAVEVVRQKHSYYDIKWDDGTIETIHGRAGWHRNRFDAWNSAIAHVVFKHQMLKMETRLEDDLCLALGDMWEYAMRTGAMLGEGCVNLAFDEKEGE